VIGHGDWHAENVRWSGNKLLVVHDWDSVVYQPEAVVAGVAAAIFPAWDGCWQPANITESEEFLDAYLRARPGPWAQDDIQAFWAATVWTRAFDAKEQSADGPVTSLSQAEAQDRLTRAGA
jgi:Ser/Thr protein kinase RdoA (MazF antagonist)